MDDLDLLKKDWQKLDNFSQVSEQEIYGMLHKKSSSIVRWLLIISILEFSLWTTLSLVFDSNKYFTDEKQIFYLNLIEYFGYGVILAFIYFLYDNYKKISTTETTKQLMVDILKTKKIVQYYVWYNLAMIVMTFFGSFIYVFLLNSKNEQLTNKFLDNPTLLLGLIVGLLVVTAIFLALFWLFYKLIYGILLKKLYSNYEELKKIDL